MTDSPAPTDVRVEAIARAICKARGIDPDYRKPVTVTTLIEGKRTDTGHDTRVFEKRPGVALPAWEEFKSEARAALAALPAPAPAKAGEPYAWLIEANNGGIVMWSRKYGEIEGALKQHRKPNGLLIPLYAHPSPDAGALREALRETRDRLALYAKIAIPVIEGDAAIIRKADAALSLKEPAGHE